MVKFCEIENIMEYSTSIYDIDNCMEVRIADVSYIDEIKYEHYVLMV